MKTLITFAGNRGFTPLVFILMSAVLVSACGGEKKEKANIWRTPPLVVVQDDTDTMTISADVPIDRMVLNNTASLVSLNLDETLNGDPNLPCPISPSIEELVSCHKYEVSAVVGSEAGTYTATIFGDLNDQRQEIGTAEVSVVPESNSGSIAIVDVQSTAAGLFALTTDGELWSWDGPLASTDGFAEPESFTVPRRRISAIGVRSISGNNGRLLFVTSEGQLFRLVSSFSTTSSHPDLVPGLDQYSIVDAQVGLHHRLALTNSGQVLSWGNNSTLSNVDAGVLGDPNRGDGQSPGFVVDAVSSLPFISVNLSNVIAIATNTYYSLALLNDGSLVEWGCRSEVNSSTGTGPDRCLSDGAVPVVGISNVQSIAVGHNHALALLADGSVMAWGDNYFGQLGPSVPVGGFYSEPILVNGIGPVDSLLGGSSRRSGAILSNGSAVHWGDGDPSIRSLPLPAGVDSVRAVNLDQRIVVDNSCNSGGRVWGETLFRIGTADFPQVFSDNDTQREIQPIEDLLDNEYLPVLSLGSDPTAGCDTSRAIIFVTGSGSGTVTSDVGSVQCGLTPAPGVQNYCWIDVPENEGPLTLTALPDENSSFDSWRWDCESDEPETTRTLSTQDLCKVVFTENEEVVLDPPAACNDGIDNDSDSLIDLADPGCSDANDDNEADEPVSGGAVTLTLTILGGPGAGQVSSTDALIPTMDCSNSTTPETTCNANFTSGTLVELIPEPFGTGNADVQWTGCDMDSGIEGCSLTMNGNRSVTATFVAGPPSNNPPVARIDVSPTTGITTATTLNFDAAMSSDSDGTIDPVSGYRWDFDSDGIVDAMGITASFVYTTPGSYTVTLEVIDSDGDSDTETAGVFVAAEPSSGFTLTLTFTGNGGTIVSNENPSLIDCSRSGGLPTVCTAIFASGSNVSLIPSPTVGGSDVQWTGCDMDIGIEGCSLTMIADRSVTASFVTGSSSNSPPQIILSILPNAGVTTQTVVTFDASNSLDFDGTIDPVSGYLWDFDSDGVVDAMGATTTYTYPVAGEYIVTLEVIDDDGASAIETNRVVRVADAP